MNPVTQLEILRSMVLERERRARARRLRRWCLGAMLTAAWTLSMVVAMRAGYTDGAIDARIASGVLASVCDADARPDDYLYAGDKR